MTIKLINDPAGRNFKATVQAMLAAKAKLPQGFVFNPNLCAGSKLAGGGMTVGPDNRPRRIPNSDPEVHKGKSVIVNPLIVTTIAAEDEPEMLTEDDAPELDLSVAPIEAGTDTPDESEEQDDEVGADDGEEEAGAE